MNYSFLIGLAVLALILGPIILWAAIKESKRNKKT